MNYVLKPGDLVFVRGTDWISREIEYITHSTYSHVAGVVNDTQLIEANAFQKTGYVGLIHYTGRADVYTCDLLTDEQRRHIIEYVRSFVGTRYDYLLIVWEAARYLLHLVWPYYEGKARICSTLWSDAYRSAGVDLCPGVKYPTPGDMAQSKLLRKVESY
jgi:hypothetical protein